METTSSNVPGNTYTTYTGAPATIVTFPQQETYAGSGSSGNPLGSTGTSQGAPYIPASNLSTLQRSSSAESTYDPSVTDADVNKNRGVRGFWNKMTAPIKYQSKSKFSQFEHDNACMEDINLLRCFHQEYMNMSKTVDALVDCEKVYCVGTLRQATRMNEIVQPANTSAITDQMKAWVELELQLAQLHSNWVGENLIELQNMFHQINKQNIKAAKLKKHELNVAAMNRADFTRSHLKKVDVESKRYFDEKHDEMGVRLAEERKLMAQGQYETAARQLEGSIQDLYDYERGTVLEQTKKFLLSRKQYHEYCINLINLSYDKIQSLPVPNIQLPYQKYNYRSQVLTTPVGVPTTFQTGSMNPEQPTITVGRDFKYGEQPVSGTTTTPKHQVPTA